MFLDLFILPNIHEMLTKDQVPHYTLHTWQSKGETQSLPSQSLQSSKEDKIQGLTNMMRVIGDRRETQAEGNERFPHENHQRDKMNLATHEERVECSRQGKV